MQINLTYNMKINKFNENNDNTNSQLKICYGRYRIDEYDDDIKILLQDSEYLSNIKIDHTIYYNYFDIFDTPHFTFKIYAFPINSVERVILGDMNYEFLINGDDNKKNINKNNSWTEINHDDILATINTKKFNL